MRDYRFGLQMIPDHLLLVISERSNSCRKVLRIFLLIKDFPLNFNFQISIFNYFISLLPL